MSSPAGEPALDGTSGDLPARLDKQSSMKYPLRAYQAAAAVKEFESLIAGRKLAIRVLRQGRDRAVLDVLSAGVGVTDTSRLCGVSLSTVKQIRLRKGK
jgi:hypothetical protein